MGRPKKIFAILESDPETRPVVLLGKAVICARKVRTNAGPATIYTMVQKKGPAEAQVRAIVMEEAVR